MFNDSGKKLKIVAIIVFFVSIFAGVCLGCASILLRNNLIGIVIGIGFIVVSIIFAWLAALLIYSFGQLVHSTENNEMLLKRINKRLDKIEKNQGTEQDTPTQE